MTRTIICYCRKIVKKKIYNIDANIKHEEDDVGSRDARMPITKIPR